MVAGRAVAVIVAVAVTRTGGAVAVNRVGARDVIGVVMTGEGRVTAIPIRVVVARWMCRSS